MIALKNFPTTQNYIISTAFSISQSVGTTEVTGATASLTVSGVRLCWMGLCPEYNRTAYAEGTGTGDVSYISNAGTSGQVRFYQGATNIASLAIQTSSIQVPVSSYSIYFLPNTSGNISFSVKFRNGASALMDVLYAALVVIEL